MMPKRLTQFGLYAMTVLAVVVAIHAMRFEAVPAHIWLGIDSGIRGVIARVPLQALTHMLVAPFALLLGPFQFMPRIRARYPRFHRWSGRIYVAACLISGIAALAIAPHASGGPVAGLGFGLLALLWIGATLAGWRTAVARNFAAHRIWMRFSYAMTFGAVTLRLQIPIGFIVFGYHSYSAMSVWLAYTSWIPNVVAVGLYTLAANRQMTVNPPDRSPAL